MYPPMENVIPIDKGVDVIPPGVFVKLGFELRQLLRIFLCQVDALVEVGIQIVKLPDIIIESILCRIAVCGMDGKVDDIGVVVGFSLPAVLVDAAGAEDIVVLFFVAGSSLCVVEAVYQ